ncbi:putative conjugative transfer protein TraW [Orientia tsutsugamushi str. Gilliam]|uniref:Putative conjugative transfer protein TraW n=1 Tax=Orientia tsutsugamushi str. Gilliam TaxID=1359184 RepID=A0A0F3M9A6_ORITS|nr:putative conjugative transfer protein TraW [Orientia tsutsugamushi str. Gilliam]
MILPMFKKDDIKTKNGIIIVKGETKINPLEIINWVNH